MDAVLDIASYFFWIALALGILVFIHELGHFLFARLFGMRVDAFSIGFPPVFWRKQIGETEWRLGAVPLGGYVKIAGMIDESVDTEFVDQEPQPDEFRSKPVWQRMLVISGGVLFNLILAFVIFIGLTLWYGEAYTPLDRVEGVFVADSSVAYGMGLRTGDRVVAVNGRRPERFEDVLSAEALTADPFTLTVERGGQTLTLEGPDQLLSRVSRAEGFGLYYAPSVVGMVEPGSPADEAGLQPGDYLLALGDADVRQWPQLIGAVAATGGEPTPLRYARPAAGASEGADALEGAAVYTATVVPEPVGDGYRLGVGVDQDFGREYARYGFFEAVGAGSQLAWEQVTLYGSLFSRLFTGKENVRDSVGGPLMIAKMTKEAADQGLQSFWVIVAMLSIALAVFNILPIPVLDGGHLVFLLYEAVVRREPSVRVRVAVQQVGLVLLLAFMVFVIFNDAVRWFG